MDTKEIKITVPEGYEIDKENSTFECIKFKKKKKLTYEDVCDVLFTNKTAYYTTVSGDIAQTDSIESYHTCDGNNAVSKNQLEQLLAINKLMNVAAYLNENPSDWDNLDTDKWYIYYDHAQHKIAYAIRKWCNAMDVYFDSTEHAYAAVEILGEDVVKCALGVFD